jgi:hypothetical protein
MKNRFIILIVGLLSSFVFLPHASAQTAGQPKTSKSQAVKTQAFDPRDFNGVWGGQSTALLTKGEPPMTTWALERFKAAKTPYSNPPVTGEKINDPAFSCEPFGAPRIYFFPHPMKMIQEPDKIVMLFAADRIFRIIRLNAQHPEHPFDTFYGDSIGSWEGNTLVVDTVNFYSERTWLDPAGHPHSDQLHLTERFARPDRNHLHLDITIEDPVAYTKPWGGEKIFTLEPSTGTLHNVMCVPENKPQILKDFFASEVSSVKK